MRASIREKAARQAPSASVSDAIAAPVTTMCLRNMRRANRMSLNTDSTHGSSLTSLLDSRMRSRLPNCLDAANSAASACHPCGDEVVYSGLDVELHFLIQGAIDGRRPEHVCHSRQPGHQFLPSLNLGVLEHVVDRTCRGTPSLFFEAELTASFSRDFVRSRAAVMFGRNLACSYPAGLLHSVEGRDTATPPRRARHRRGVESAR